MARKSRALWMMQSTSLRQKTENDPDDVKDAMGEVNFDAIRAAVGKCDFKMDDGLSSEILRLIEQASFDLLIEQNPVYASDVIGHIEAIQRSATELAKSLEAAIGPSSNAAACAWTILSSKVADLNLTPIMGVCRALATGAHEAAILARSYPAHHKSRRSWLKNLIIGLAEVWQAATGSPVSKNGISRPAGGEIGGPFFRFVKATIEYVPAHPTISDQGLGETIRRALRLARERIRDDGSKMSEAHRAGLQGVLSK